MRIIRLLCFLIFIAIGSSVAAQVVYQDLQKTSIYNFLDELANLQLIQINSAVKPYSRAFIAGKLAEIDPQSLNERQKNELAFFFKDYNKELLKHKDFDKRIDLFYYTDSLFSITVNPIFGAKFQTNENDSYWSRYSGGEFFGTIGKFGFYANLRDHVSSDVIQNDLYLNKDQGNVYKGSGDFSEFKGGLSYGWEWGSVGLIKDRLTIGNNNFGANIISNKAPSFARIELKIKPTEWLELNYFHGFLSSQVLDSSRSYVAGVQERKIFVRKYIASNLFTITPFNNFNFSIGNSIVYSDNFEPAFLIPFAFFKSIDHAIYAGGGNYGGGNSQIFVDVSSRNLKGYHIYSTLFVDEISFSRFWDKDEHSNFLSWKLGVQRSNLFNKNITLTAEYTRTNPITYKHFVNTTTYESNNYNLGHQLRDNAQEFTFKIDYKPLANLCINTSIIMAKKGEEYNYVGTDESVWGLPFIEDTKWKSNSFQLNVNYEIVNDVIFFLGYEIRTVSGSDMNLYTNSLYQGDTQTISAGFNVGF